tara:strand:+ start:226 stop:732 length:507 start_codon:yes stop_codon:yes gene_type:complete
MIGGKIYKIVADHTEDVYIGSTAQHYLSRRMACHRLNAKKNNQCYGDLFSDPTSPPRIELIEHCETDHRDLLRKRERDILEQTEKTINLRSPYVTEEERKERHKQMVKNYHTSPAGKLSLTKANHRQKIKKLQAKIDDNTNNDKYTSEEIADVIYMLEVLREKLLSKI